MKFRALLTMSLCAFCALSSPANALDKPTHSTNDKRLLYTDFKAGEVYPINAANGLMTTIIFAPGEEVKSYASGYSSAWEFAHRGNHFFLKPKDKLATTNLVVLTDKRTYFFEVRLTSRAKATFSLQFAYPGDLAQKAQADAQKQAVKGLLEQDTLPTSNTESKAEGSQKQLNRAYTENFGASRTSKRIAPLEVFDDGQFTYIKFDRQTDFPAVYRVEEGDTETMLNAHVKKDYLVVHGVYEELRLRAGLGVVGIYNEAYSGTGVANNTGVTVPGLERVVKGGSDE